MKSRHKKFLSSTARSRADDKSHVDPEEESDFVWGAAQIGAVINKTPQQVYYLISLGVLDGAVRKFGHRTIGGSRRRLRELFDTS